MILDFLFALAMTGGGVSLFLLGFRYGRRMGHADGKREAAEEFAASFVSGLPDDDKGRLITAEFYELHCGLTVASHHYGTPDWLTHLAFKLFGESGEFAEHLGKASRDDGWSIFAGAGKLTPERRMNMLKELGDMLWYIVMLAKELGSSFAEIMLINIRKREGRKVRGTLQGAGDDR